MKIKARPESSQDFLYTLATWDGGKEDTHMSRRFQESLDPCLPARATADGTCLPALTVLWPGRAAWRPPETRARLDSLPCSSPYPGSAQTVVEHTGR